MVDSIPVALCVFYNVFYILPKYAQESITAYGIAAKTNF